MLIPPSKMLRIAAVVASMVSLISPAFAGRQGRVDLGKMETPNYTVDGDAFVGHNGQHYNNRPLYCSHIYAIVLSGDKPYCQVGDKKIIFGNMMFALVRDGKGKWLLDASDVTSKYRPGRMEWDVKDVSWGTTTVRVEVLPTSEGPGLAARVSVEDIHPGDKLVWASGASVVGAQSILWTYDVTSQKSPFINRGFVPTDCAENAVEVSGSSWIIRSAKGKDAPAGFGRSSENAKIVVADANAWRDPVALQASYGEKLPIACGTVALASKRDIYFSLRGDGTGKTAEQEFAAGMARELAIEKQVVVSTPDPWFDAAVGASVNVEDALFREGIYTHSGMRWSTALLGWRTIFGATVFGWHDNVKTQARTCIAKQITSSDYKTPRANPDTLLTSQAADSRMFGKGRVDLDHPHHYDMQSQFFDQIQHAWRWTGDAELEKLLRPSLDLDCEYIKDCFDPSGLGIYESYANTWPTDDQWYNGGGTSEETAYAYRAERTALELARRAGDDAGVKLHTAAVERIRKGFFDLLWIPERGHPGAYREQIGLKRVHESCWLYGIFCPIDAGLLDAEQSAESLQYTETELERIKLPYGGEQCWPSNWVPSIWSVREMWSGDNYQLALAYFQTGLPDDGWKVLRGTFPQQAMFGPVPGDMGHPSGGTDFNDCNSMMARAVVEGVFGYRPDYPNGLVTVAPQFPSDWKNTSITTPDMSLSYTLDGAVTRCKVTLVQPCAMEVQIPVSTKKVASVEVDGKPVKWQVSPGFGRSIVKIDVPSSGAVDVNVTCEDKLATYPSKQLAANTGGSLTLAADDGKIVDFHDPQGILKSAKVDNGVLTGTVTANAGDHMVLALAQVGEEQQWRIFKIHVTDAAADLAAAAKTQVRVPAGAKWENIHLDSVLNGDIRTIYEQQYLSPRPNTCSLRLATDGYSTWQMSGGKGAHKAPAIKLENVKTDSHGDISTGDGVPFSWPGGGKNIAFTSSWDNWPKRVDVPVEKAGDAIWFLLCGTTNPMEVRIANADLLMKYADGVVEKLEIVPPFNFWTLCPFSGVDYDYQRDGFALPKTPPTTLQLGTNCRAVALSWKLRPGVALKSVTLETLSDEVIVGLMGVTVMNPR